VAGERGPGGAGQTTKYPASPRGPGAGPYASGVITPSIGTARFCRARARGQVAADLDGDQGGVAALPVLDREGGQAAAASGIG